MDNNVTTSFEMEFEVQVFNEDTQERVTGCVRASNPVVAQHNILHWAYVALGWSRCRTLSWKVPMECAA